nr:LOW QUALITY PROTEIN: putative golgin subfamily A member 6-like protein 3 [Macaca nemestrina]
MELFGSASLQLKEYWQRKSPGVPAGANRKKKINGSSPDTATSGGHRSPVDSATGVYREGPVSSTTLKDLESSSNSSSLHAPQSQYQELAGAPDSSSTIISQPSENIHSLGRVQWRPLIPRCQSCIRFPLGP